jgi:hypothetical protein
MSTEQVIWGCTFYINVKLVHYAESGTWRVIVTDKDACDDEMGGLAASQQFKGYTEAEAREAALRVALEYMRSRERLRWDAMEK